MMKKLENEQGYALLVVVLIIVLIMGFFTAFMTMSLSNAKQEQIVDQEHLKVAAAEMGVEYFSSAFINDYYSFISGIDLDYIIESENSLNNEELYYRVQQNVKNQLIDHLHDTAASLTGEEQNVNNNDNAYFYRLNAVTDIKFNDESFLVIDGTVIGNKVGSDKHAELKFSQFFDVPFLRTSFTGESPSQGDNSPTGEKIDIKKMIDAEFNNYEIVVPESCSRDFSSGGNLSKEKCLIGSNNYYINNNPLVLSNDSLIYSRHSLTINHKVKLTDSQIHSNNQLTINNHPLELANSIVYSDKKLQANQGIDISNQSTVYVKNDATLTNRNSHINKSRLIVDGHLYISGNTSLNVLNGSTLIIRQQLNVQNKDLNIESSNVYVGNHAELPVGSVNLDNNSNLYIDGQLVIGNEGKLNVKGNSKVCITNKFTIAKASNLNIEKGSFVYIPNNEGNYSHDRIIKKSKNELNELCNGPPSSNSNDVSFETLYPEYININVNYK